MAQIIYQDAVCEECKKPLPKFTVAEVIQPDFIVCVECNEHTESDWRDFCENYATFHENNEV